MREAELLKFELSSFLFELSVTEKSFCVFQNIRQLMLSLHYQPCDLAFKFLKTTSYTDFCLQCVQIWI